MKIAAQGSLNRSPLIHFLAGIAAQIAVHRLMGAMLRHEGAIDLDVVAAGGLQAIGVPGVDDLVIALGQQEGAVFGRAAGFREDQRAQENPVAMLAAGGEAPLAGQVEAAIGLLDLADRLVGRRDQDARILGPDIFLRLEREQAHLQRMNADDAQHPGAGHAALGDGDLHLEEDVGFHLEAAPALGLQNVEEAGFLEIADGFVRDLAGCLAGLRPFAQHRDHGLGARNQGRGVRIDTRRRPLLHRCHHNPVLRHRQERAPPVTVVGAAPIRNIYSSNLRMFKKNRHFPVKV